MKHLLLVCYAMALSAVVPIESPKAGGAIILLDRTGSMLEVRSTGNTRCEDAITVATVDVADYFATHSSGSMAVWTFANDTVAVITDRFVGRFAAINAINDLDPDGCFGATPLAEAICGASDALAAHFPSSGRDLYVSSDGGENNSSGPCEGPDAYSSDPWTPGSWQAKVIENLTDNAVVNVRYWGAVAKSGDGTDVETGLSPKGGSFDLQFFQEMASATGGSYNGVVDCNCPFLYCWNGREYSLVNNILPQSEFDPGRDKVDFCLIPDYATDAGSGECRLIIREDEQEVSYLDQFKLLVYDLPPDAGRVEFDKDYSPTQVVAEMHLLSAVTDRGEDVRRLLDGADGLEFEAHESGRIDLTYGFVGAAGSILSPPTPDELVGNLIKFDVSYPARGLCKVFDTHSAKTNIALYMLSEVGVWELVDHIYPRLDPPEVTVPLSYLNADDNLLQLRLEWSGSVTIDCLPLLVCQALPVEPVEAQLVNAFHSSTGNVAENLSASDDRHVVLKPGQRVELLFDLPPVEQGKTRSLALLSKGRYEALGRLTGDGNPNLPCEFSFAQPYPNPTNPGTTFEFSLPHDARAQLEVYNLLGQRVRVLVDEELTSGRHTARWDGRSDIGGPVASGVYFARLVAGEYSASRKIIVLK